MVLNKDTIVYFFSDYVPQKGETYLPNDYEQ